MKRIIIIVNIILLLFLGYFHYSMNRNNRKNNRKHYLEKMKTVVQIPFSLAEEYERISRINPQIKRNQIQQEFITISEKLSYDKNDYFFILDSKGNTISNPLRPSLSWWNMLNETDNNGNYIFKDIIKKILKDGDGYIETQWSSKYNDEIIEDQIIYGKYFWPWDWIIFTTLYENEIIFEQNVMNLSVIIVIVSFLIIFNILFIFLLRRLCENYKGNQAE